MVLSRKTSKIKINILCKAETDVREAESRLEFTRSVRCIQLRDVVLKY